jgi:hypothetical protein
MPAKLPIMWQARWRGLAEAEGGCHDNLRAAAGNAGPEAAYGLKSISRQWADVRLASG